VRVRGVEEERFKIGSLLVKEGFVTEKDLERAEKLQERHEKESKMPLNMILVHKGFLTGDEVDRMIARPEIQQDIERLFVENGFVDQQALNACRAKKQPDEQITDVLVREGHITKEQLKTVYDMELESIDLAKLALKMRMITERELEEALIFKRYRRAIGEILCDMNLITLSELNLVFQKYNKRLKLGEFLLQQEIIDKDTLEKQLEEQNRTGEPLGGILIRNSLITVDQLYFALSVQFNIPFHDLDGFVFYEKQKIALRDIVGQKFAEENLVLPLFLNGNNLTVAISDPSRGWVANDLRSIYKRFRISCVLVTDEKFEQLFAILYGETLKPFRNHLTGEGGDVSNSNGILITDPAKDEMMIEDLYEKYRSIAKRVRNEMPQSDISIFREFIEDSFRNICEKFHCSKVSFYVEEGNEQVEILAAPLIGNVSRADHSE